MEEKFWIYCKAFSVAIIFIAGTYGSVRLEVGLLQYRYTSPYSCDNILFFMKCDPFFRICLETPPDYRCDWIKTSSISEKNVLLDILHGSQIKPNPVLKRLDTWQGNVTLRIQTWDENFLSPDAIIDEAIWAYSGAANASLGDITLVGKDGRASVTVYIKIQCDNNFYGSSCFQFCEPTPSTYCDENGTSVCYPGAECDSLLQSTPSQITTDLSQRVFTIHNTKSITAQMSTRTRNIFDVKTPDSTGATYNISMGNVITSRTDPPKTNLKLVATNKNKSSDKAFTTSSFPVLSHSSTYKFSRMYESYGSTTAQTPKAIHIRVSLPKPIVNVSDAIFVTSNINTKAVSLRASTNATPITLYRQTHAIIKPNAENNETYNKQLLSTNGRFVNNISFHETTIAKRPDHDKTGSSSRFLVSVDPKISTPQPTNSNVKLLSQIIQKIDTSPSTMPALSTYMYPKPTATRVSWKTTSTSAKPLRMYSHDTSGPKSWRNNASAASSTLSAVHTNNTYGSTFNFETTNNIFTKMSVWLSSNQGFVPTSLTNSALLSSKPISTTKQDTKSNATESQQMNKHGSTSSINLSESNRHVWTQNDTLASKFPNNIATKPHNVTSSRYIVMTSHFQVTKITTSPSVLNLKHSPKASMTSIYSPITIPSKTSASISALKTTQLPKIHVSSYSTKTFINKTNAFKTPFNKFHKVSGPSTSREIQNIKHQVEYTLVNTVSKHTAVVHTNTSYGQNSPEVSQKLIESSTSSPGTQSLEIMASKATNPDVTVIISSAAATNDRQTQTYDMLWGVGMCVGVLIIVGVGCFTLWTLKRRRRSWPIPVNNDFEIRGSLECKEGRIRLHRLEVIPEGEAVDNPSFETEQNTTH